MDLICFCFGEVAPVESTSSTDTAFNHTASLRFQDKTSYGFARSNLNDADGNCNTSYDAYKSTERDIIWKVYINRYNRCRLHWRLTSPEAV